MSFIKRISLVVVMVCFSFWTNSYCEFVSSNALTGILKKYNKKDHKNYIFEDWKSFFENLVNDEYFEQEFSSCNKSIAREQRRAKLGKASIIEILSGLHNKLFDPEIDRDLLSKIIDKVLHRKGSPNSRRSIIVEVIVRFYGEVWVKNGGNWPVYLVNFEVKAKEEDDDYGNEGYDFYDRVDDEQDISGDIDENYSAMVLEQQPEDIAFGEWPDLTGAFEIDPQYPDLDFYQFNKKLACGFRNI